MKSKAKEERLKVISQLPLHTGRSDAIRALQSLLHVFGENEKSALNGVFAAPCAPLQTHFLIPPLFPLLLSSFFSRAQNLLMKSVYLLIFLFVIAESDGYYTFFSIPSIFPFLLKCFPSAPLVSSYTKLVQRCIQIYSV